MPGHNFKPNDLAGQPSSVDAFMKKYPNQPSVDPVPELLRDLVDEIRGLRNDIRREVLQREIAKLPAPIKNAT